MKAIISACIFLFISVNAKTQSPVIEWQNAFGGSGADVANSVQQANDGGYIVAGHTSSENGDVSGSHGGDDFWVIKLNSSGALQWQKTYGGSDLDYGKAIQQTADGGYIVAGSTLSTDGDVSGNQGAEDFWVVKLDGNGGLQWQKSLGGSGTDVATSIQQANDGGYVVAGYTSSNNGDVSGNHGGSDFWVVKLDGDGALQWQKTLGGSTSDRGNAVQQTTDGGYIVAGQAGSNNGDVTGNHGVFDFWVVKLDADGILQWQKALGGSGGDVAYAVRQSADGGYIVAGYAGSTDGDVTGYHGGVDVWVAKLDANGVLQWQKALGSTQRDEAYAIQQTIEGGYIVAGVTGSVDDGDVSGTHGGSDYWVVKLAADGAMQWQKALGGTVLDRAYSIRQTTGNGFIVAGVAISNNGDVSGNHGLSDFWVVKLAQDITLPVQFGKISVVPGGHQLQVRWETVSEQNCSHFNIEISTDGASFKKAGTVASKAFNGNSSALISYEFIVPVDSLPLTASVLLPSLLLSLLIGRKRFPVWCLGVLLCLLMTTAACRKNNNGVRPDASSRKIFVRIAQVDKDARIQYSKVVRVILRTK
ncbi:MAG: hypothetical protein KF746_22790 [Chitinophagaceae bacterium]|nr:hypothetical protein [Chitinophagaceae bacterium]